MRFIVYNGPDIVKVINTLNNSGYSLSNFTNYFSFLFATENHKILIALKCEIKTI